MHASAFSKWFPSVLLALAAVLLPGCAGYKLGPVNGMAAGEKSVQISPFQNQTMEPRLTEAVTAALRKRLQQDGTFRLNTRDDSDIMLTGEITKYERSELSFQPGDIRTIRDYYITVTVRAKAVERRTGNVLLESPVTGRTTIRSGADQTSLERQALPLLAEDLARNLVSLLADGGW